MKLEGGERLVLKILRDLQGDSTDYVEDTRLQAETKMSVQDVRDWLETLEGKGFVERARVNDGFSAYITAKGKQALRLIEPIRATNLTNQAATTTPTAASESPSTQPAAFTTMRTVPIQVFYSYSHKDEALRDELQEALALLKRQGCIAGWHDRQIVAGQEWADKIDENLETAKIILLLVSASFLASDYCYGKELKRALERHRAGEAVVIPIIIRPCDWQDAQFAKLQALPKDGKAVTSWTNKDEAWTDVAKGLRRAVEAFGASS